MKLKIYRDMTVVSTILILEYKGSMPMSCDSGSVLYTRVLDTYGQGTLLLEPRDETFPPDSSIW